MFADGNGAALLTVALVSWELTKLAVGQEVDVSCDTDHSQGCMSSLRSENGTDLAAMVNETSEQEQEDDDFFTGASKSRGASESSVAVALVFIALFNFGFCCCCWCCCRVLDSIGYPHNTGAPAGPFRRIPLRALFNANSQAPSLETVAQQSFNRAEDTVMSDAAPTSPGRKSMLSVVIVQPGGGVGIGVQEAV